MFKIKTTEEVNAVTVEKGKEGGKKKTKAGHVTRLRVMTCHLYD